MSDQVKMEEGVQPPTAASNATEPTTEPVSNGMMYGVLLEDGLLIKRGGRWVTAECARQQTVTPVPGMYQTVHVKPCIHDCVMFGEPKWFNDGTAELKICCGEVLRFNRLIDMRGHLEGINLTIASRDEIVDWMFQNNIIRNA